MRGIPRLVWRVILGATVLLAAGVIALWLLGPTVARSAITRSLRDRGFADAELAVSFAGPRHVTIDDLQLDREGRLTARTVVATYRPLRLLRGELESLRIVGARWVVRRSEGELDLGPLTELLEARARGTADGAFPFDCMELAASEIVVETDRGRWRLPLDGVLERETDGLHIRLSSAIGNIPVQGRAEITEGPSRETRFDLSADPPGPGRISIEGRSTPEGRIRLQASGQGLSTDTVIAGRRLGFERLRIAGHATIARDPLTVESLHLDLAADEPRIDAYRFHTFTAHAEDVGDRLAMTVGWTAPGHAGSIAVRGLPSQLDSRAWRGARPRWRATATLQTEAEPVTLFASATSTLRREDDAWGVDVEDGRLALSAPRWTDSQRGVQLQAVRVALGFAGALDPDQLRLWIRERAVIEAEQIRLGTRSETLALHDVRLDLAEPSATQAPEPPVVRVRLVDDGEPTIETHLSIAGQAGAVVAGALKGALPRIDASLRASRAEGDWRLQGRTDLRLADVRHTKADVRIAQVSASLPVTYPFTEDPDEAPGSIRIGPITWRDTALPAITGTLTRRGDDVAVALRWPLTRSVAARARGTLSLNAPLSGTLDLQAPSFELEDAQPAVTLLEALVGGSVRGKASFRGRIVLADGSIDQTLRIRIDDASVSRSGFLEELRGIEGTLDLDSIIPPRSPGGQRLTWKGGRAGRVQIGAGHVDLTLEPDRTLLVEEVFTTLGEDGTEGRLFAGAFRYAPDTPKLELDVFAESLGLQQWLDLLGRDEVRAHGTLHGHLSATVHLEPTLRVELGKGALVAEPGGTIALRDVRAARAVLAPSTTTLADPGALQSLLQERLLEALQSLRYSALRFEVVRQADLVTLRIHLAGQGTRGARQEIGGLTININHIEDAVNEYFRLLRGVQELQPEISNEVHHAPAATPP